MSLERLPSLLPQTRFLHAGQHVYKFKIRYGHFPSAPDPDSAQGAAEELEEAIRVILGNLDDLHPFSTDHFTVFPYLSKWERAWKMRFTHGNVRLTPYPYVCTLYLELNSFPQHGSSGTEGTTGREELQQSPHQTLTTPSCDGLKVRRSSETARAAGEGAGQSSRVAAGAEPSCPQSGMNSAGAERVPRLRKAKRGQEMGSYRKFKKSSRHLFGPQFSKCPAEKRLQNSSRANEGDFSPAALPKDWDRGSCCGLVASNLDETAAPSLAEGTVWPQQQLNQTEPEGPGQLAGRGFSQLWRRYCSIEQAQPDRARARACAQFWQCQGFRLS